MWSWWGTDDGLGWGDLGGFRLLLKKSGCRTPRIELEEIGPSLDLVLRRTHLASDDLYKLAHRQPKALKVSRKSQPQPTCDCCFSILSFFLPIVYSFVLDFFIL